MAHILDSEILPKESFKYKNITVNPKPLPNVKQRPLSGRTWVCIHTDNEFTYVEGDNKTKSDLNSFVNTCNKDLKSGKKTIKVVYGGKGMLSQAPDNKWMILEDTQRFGVTKPPIPKIIADPNKTMIGRITEVTGELVYLKDSTTGFAGLKPYIKISGKDKNFPYIPVRDSKTDKLVVEPYYAWVISKEKDYARENPEILAKAKDKMGIDSVAAIQAGKYTYSFDAAEEGQIDLETANNEILDDVRYSISGDTRSLYKINKNNTPVYIYDNDSNTLTFSGKRLNEGHKIKSLGKVAKKFRYRLNKMLNYDGNFFIATTKLKKLSNESFEVKVASRPFSLIDGRIIPSKNNLVRGTILNGSVTTPLIEKQFSFVIIGQKDNKTLFVNESNVDEMISEIGGKGNTPLINSYKDASYGFEGGDIEDFHGGDVNFSGNDRPDRPTRPTRPTRPAHFVRLQGQGNYPKYNSSITQDLFRFNGNERLLSFDDNSNIPIYDDNTQMYFNMDSNVGVLGSYESNADIDLSFDANEEEEVSNAVGDWFKKLFSKKNKDISPSDAKKIADPNKVEYSTKEVSAMYNKSGSKKPFRDWLKSDDSKQFLTNLSQIGYALLLTKAQGGVAPNNIRVNDNGNTDNPYQNNEDDYNNDSSNTEEDKKILGLHPITFGVTASLLFVGLGVGIWLYAKRNK